MKLEEYKKQIAPESETDINRQCVKYVEGLGFDAYRMNAGRVKVKGGYFYGAKKSTPDYFFSIYGFVVWFEGKKTGKTANTEQVKRHKELRAKGDYVICTDDYDKFIHDFNCVEKLLRMRRNELSLRAATIGEGK